MMRRLLGAIGSSIGIAIIVAVVLSVCVWFFGGFLGFGNTRPFESVIGRLIAIAALWIIVLLTILVILLRRQKRDTALTDEIVNTTEPAAGVRDERVTADLDDMRTKLKAAMTKLRKSRLGRRHLFELPWYIMIGPPGAGKTTAILNSGLRFPLADEMGKSAIGGVGGTRNCDWWFTENAVLVDTAGRYTIQESDAEVDNAAWLGFLGILRKHRRRQPINGAIVAISLSDLSMQDELTQKGHAIAIRRRLNELHDRLEIRFPVYVLFTKADLLAGFNEFFEPLGKEDREQVWGFTLPLPGPQSEAAPAEAFEREYTALIERLNMQSLERVQAEADPQRRSLIAGFPSQVASMQRVAHDFLAELFQESRFEQRHLLRGVYFTSGTQEGTPIDRLMMGMARTFGIGRQAIGTGRGTGRSYFLTRLFQGVIFPESGLVSAHDKVERRYRLARAAAIAATVVIALGAGVLWPRSYLGNRALAMEVETELETYRQMAAQIPASPISDTDLPGVVPALNVLRGLPGNPAAGETAVPEGLGWGLYQGGVLGTEAEQAYRAALNQHFLPRLILRLEEQMQGAINEPEVLYEALKVYLMLGTIGPMNVGLVSEWMQLDWALGYAGPTREALRADLADHLTALLDQPIEPIDLNSDLVTLAQEVLAEMPQAERVYKGIINSPTAAALEPWRLTDIGGPALSRVIVRSSGKPLTDGIPGIFTYAGFHDVFLAEALGVATRIQRDSWVLGPSAETEPSEAALAVLSRDVLDLYYDNFVAEYDRMLGDIDIIPLESPSHAAEVTNVLSGQTSPVINILTAIADETRLTEDRSAVLPEGTEGITTAGAAEALRAGANQLNPAMRRILGAAGDGTPAAAPGAYVESRFAWLQELIAREGDQPSQLDTLLGGPLREVYEELRNIVGGTGPGEGSALVRFQQQAAELGGPLQRWATQIATGSSGITADSTRAGISARWQANVLPFCTQATRDAYPFNRRSQADIALQDFGRLFAPGGMIDAFVQENLLQYIDIRSRPWVWKPVNEIDLGISQAVLDQMYNAAQIRDAFFVQGASPTVAFQITPEALDPNAAGIMLEIDGQTIEFQHTSGQPRPVAVTWPGTVGLARVAFFPQLAGSGNMLSREGPWAWFRLLDAAAIRSTNVSDRKRIIFNVGGRTGIFRMQAGSVLDPFSLRALYEFSCPETF